ncbi:PH domain-containing protein [Ottowia thiooxydans]|uniref:PH domain-containing protein n=1 Tax=Ottowia thiooxydans TaxID=219182 RepID=UPI0003FB6841|nr:PH domain-containing protein [Ottowia thiooxydans]
MFRSKVDPWLAAVILISALFVLGSVAVVWPRAAWLPGKFVMVAVVLLGSGLPLWLLVSTVYRVDETNLTIQSGPLRWRIPLQSIRAVEPSRSWISSPALSLDRLCIHHGRVGQALVSPKQKQAFIQALQQRNPQIRVQGF